MTRVLDHHGLAAVGGFTPLLLHVAAHDPVPEVDRLLDAYEASGAGVLVLSAVTGAEGYDTRAVLHPHVGTMVENGAEVRRVLEGSSISLCLDTGHLLIGGTDPAELARQAPERIAHVHFKDVDARLAGRVQDGRLTYTQGVREGMYRPLGSGDVDVPAIVGSLAPAATTAGTCWSGTPSSPGSRPARARWPTCGPAPTTSARSCAGPGDGSPVIYQPSRYA
jgi:inosose dehydratase